MLGGLLVAAAAAAGGSTAGSHEALRAIRHFAKTARLDPRLAGLSDQTVRVELLAAHAGVRALVARAGGKVEASYGGLIEATVPTDALAGLSSSAAVRYVREPVRPVPEAVGGQGVVATGADAWHRAGGLGYGVKIGVLDVGFDGYRAGQSNGDLPSSLVKADFCPAGGFQATAHGTAVAEIVAEMAPAAKLYLMCAQDEAGLGQAVQYARRQGIQI